MKTNVLNVQRTAGTLLLTTAPQPAYQSSSLRLPATDNMEWADVVLRFALLTCLLSAFAICGFRVNPTLEQAGESTNPARQNWSQVVPHVPALPAVQSGFSIR